MTDDTKPHREGIVELKVAQIWKLAGFEALEAMLDAEIDRVQAEREPKQTTKPEDCTPQQIMELFDYGFGPDREAITACYTTRGKGKYPIVIETAEADCAFAISSKTLIPKQPTVKWSRWINAYPECYLLIYPTREGADASAGDDRTHVIRIDYMSDGEVVTTVEKV